MRRTVLALLVVSASCLGAVAAAPARAGDAPADALAAADRHEAEGRALLERGEKVAAAKHMMEAWALRARAWSRESAAADVANIAMLRRQSAAAEAEAHELRAAGRLAEADGRIQEASALWKKAEALELALRQRTEGELKSKDATAARPTGHPFTDPPAKPPSNPFVDAMERDARARQAAQAAAARREVEEQVKRLEAEGANLWASGRVAEAEERMAKAAALRQRLRATAKDGAPGASEAEADAKAREARDERKARAEAEQAHKARADQERAAKEKAKAEARRAAEAALVGEVKQLRRQLDELRAAVEELRARLAPATAPATAPAAPAPTK